MKFYYSIKSLIDKLNNKKKDSLKQEIRMQWLQDLYACGKLIKEDN